jgi:hypothetical protein
MVLRARSSWWGPAGTKPRGATRILLAGIGASVLAAGAGAAAAASVALAAALVVLALLCLYLWYATVSPRGAVFVMFASLALIPVYVAPVYRTFSPEPTAILAFALAIALTRLGARVRFTVVDLAFAATCGAMVQAALLGPHSVLATLDELLLWVPPYIAGRAVCKRRNGAETFALGATIAGLLALPFIAYETVTRSNIFFKAAWPGTLLTQLWAHATHRPGGLLRSQGAFGHPLSMALIVGSCAIFAVALAVRADSRRRRAAWFLAAVALTLGQYTSHERSGWTILITGLLIFAVAAIPGKRRLRYVLAIAMIVVPLTLVALSATQPANREASVARAGSTADRVHLWQHALEPGAFALVGWPETTTFNHFANAVEPGKVSIDSGLLQVGDVYGLIAFIALFMVVAAVIRVAIAVRGTWAVVLPAIALADLVALAVIGFQTQIPIFIWLVVGGVSGIDLRRRSREDGSTAV